MYIFLTNQGKYKEFKNNVGLCLDKQIKLSSISSLSILEESHKINQQRIAKIVSPVIGCIFFTILTLVSDYL